MSEVRVRDADQPGDLGWIVQAHGELYAQEYGWDVTFEELVASIVGEFATRLDRGREAAWVAELDGERAGCILCTRSDDPSVAKLRLLLVTGAARGHGLGSTLVDRCIAFARHAGYRSMTLWTNDVLASARRIYEAAGFVLADEEPHHSFGRDLVGQNWTLDLDNGGT